MVHKKVGFLVFLKQVIGSENTLKYLDSFLSSPFFPITSLPVFSNKSFVKGSE